MTVEKRVSVFHRNCQRVLVLSDDGPRHGKIFIGTEGIQAQNKTNQSGSYNY